jgi:hypothetical protein
MEENTLPESMDVNLDITKKKAPIRKPQTPAIIKDLAQDMPQQLSPAELRAQKREDARARIRREYEIEKQLVTGVFRDLEVGAGGHLKFSARKYEWDPVYQADFKDGHTYTIPLWVAKHLNENCKFPVYQHRIEPGAKAGEGAKQYVNAWNHRFAFVSSDFTGLARAEAPSILVVGNQ